METSSPEKSRTMKETQSIWARQNFFPVAEIHVQMAALLDIAAGGAAFSVIGIPGILLFGDEGVKSYAAQIGKKLGVTGTATPT